jgi:hypothetical protein
MLSESVSCKKTWLSSKRSYCYNTLTSRLILRLILNHHAGRNSWCDRRLLKRETQGSTWFKIKYRRHNQRMNNESRYGNGGAPPHQRTTPTHHHNLWRCVGRHICLLVGYHNHYRHPAGHRVSRQSTREPKYMIHMTTCNGAK